MPELREVFDMTTKQVEPDVDAWRDQEKHQRRSSRNKRIGAFAVAAAIAVAAVVLVVSNRTGPSSTRPAGDPSPKPPTEASGPFFLDLRTGETTPLPEGILGGSLYFTSPDQTMLVINRCCGSPNPVSVANVDGTGIRRVTPKETDGFAARWSPDGSMLVYQQRDGTTQEIGNLFVVDVTTGQVSVPCGSSSPCRVTDFDPASYGPWALLPSFGPNGQTIIFHMPRGPDDGVSTRWDVWSVPLAGGELTLVVRDASMGVYAPDGGALAYLDSPRGDWTSSRLMVAEADGADPSVLAEGDEIGFPRWSPDGTRIAYSDGDGIHVVDVATGEASLVAEGETSDWFGDDMLVVVP